MRDQRDPRQTARWDTSEDMEAERNPSPGLQGAEL